MSKEVTPTIFRGSRPDLTQAITLMLRWTSSTNNPILQFQASMTSTNTFDISYPWFGLHTLALVKLGHGRYDRVHLAKGTLLCWKNTHQNGSAFLPPQRVRNMFLYLFEKHFLKNTKCVFFYICQWHKLVHPSICIRKRENIPCHCWAEIPPICMWKAEL